MADESKPQYRTLVKALDELRHEVDWKVLNPCDAQEVRDSYQALYNASAKAEAIVKRAKAHMKPRESDDQQS